MALTLATLGNPNPDRASGNRKIRVRTVTFDSSYPTGGESLVAADFGLKQLINVSPSLALNNVGAGDSTKTLLVRYNHATSKLQAFWSTGSAAANPEVTDTTNLSTYSVRVEAVGW